MTQSIYVPVLHAIPLFSNQGEFVEDLAMCVMVLTVMPGDLIISRGVTLPTVCSLPAHYGTDHCRLTCAHFLLATVYVLLTTVHFPVLTIAAFCSQSARRLLTFYSPNHHLILSQASRALMRCSSY